VAAGGASGDKNGREPLRPVLPPIGIPVEFFSGQPEEKMSKSNKYRTFRQQPSTADTFQ
jgi:hypothetical protein